MLADRIAERLPVTRGSMEVDHHHGVSRARIALWVPTVAPAIAEAALRATMYKEGHRILLALHIASGLHHEAMHRLLVPALELELLVRTERQVLQLGVHGGEVDGIHVDHPAGLREVELRWAVQGALQKNEATGCFMERIDMAVLR